MPARAPLRRMFGPVTLLVEASPGRLVLKAFRGTRRMARLDLQPGRGRALLTEGRRRDRRRFWSMEAGLPVGPMHEAITSFDVVNSFSATARYGRDVRGAEDRALSRCIRGHVGRLLGTLDQRALSCARQFSEWLRLPVYARLVAEPGGAHLLSLAQACPAAIAVAIEATRLGTPGTIEAGETFLAGVASGASPEGLLQDLLGGTPRGREVLKKLSSLPADVDVLRLFR